MVEIRAETDIGATADALPWPLKLVRPIVLRQFRTEAVRSLGALKAFAEGAG